MNESDKELSLCDGDSYGLVFLWRRYVRLAQPSPQHTLARAHTHARTQHSYDVIQLALCPRHVFL